jgi:hypothetical protein
MKVYKMIKREDRKYYAYFEHETVQAMLHSLFRFRTAEQAQMVTNRFAEEVIISPRFNDPKDRKAMILWVRDLDVTPEQKNLGYLGNYAKISMLKLPNGRWTLNMVRFDVPLKHHPVRQTPNRRYPNFGHPVIRAATRGKRWPTMQAAFEQLMQLHEEFPEVSVPGVNTLKITTYHKAEKGQPPVERIKLSVVGAGDEYILRIETPRTKKANPPRVKVQQTDTETPTPDPIKGKYTTMVEKRRKRRKPK